MLSKKYIIRLLTILLAVFSITANASAGGVIELPQTGETKCYDSAGAEIACAGTGQDAEIQAGVAWPDPRFTDNGDGTVTDNLTGLMWTKDANLIQTRDQSFDNDLTAGDGQVTWQHALDYAAKLNTESYLGYNDWHLPNVNELKSMIDYSKDNPSIPQGTPFTNVNSSVYWSSSTGAYATNSAWAFNMSYGHVYAYYKDSNYYVWPVRSGQSEPFVTSVISLPQTGQTKCYDESGTEIACAGTGQDGDIHAGVAWPSSRVTDNGNDTVTDNLTGLIWAKNANLPNGKKTWQQALDYVASLNSSNYLGFNDWRLPNVNELGILVNANEAAPSVWLNAQGFSNVQASGYWTSSTYAYAASGAWDVYMDVGYTSGGDKDGSNYVWPVSSGQTGSFVPSVISSNPNSGVQGETLDVTISGANFTDAESVSFGSGITVVTYTVVSDTVITANITISSSATAGTRDVSITTTNGVGTLPGGFTVTSGNLPDLTANSVTCPNTAKKRKTVAIKAVIKNVGKITAAASYAQFYLSANKDSSTIDGDTLLGSTSVKSLSKKQGRIVKYNWKVSAARGTYYIKVLCDSDNAISESNEDNNIKVSKKIKVK